MTSVVTLAARVLKVQNDSLRRIAGAQRVVGSHSQRQALSKFLEQSRTRIMSLLIRTFTNWSRSIQGISLDRSAFNPVSIASAFLTTLNSQVGSAYLQPSSFEDFYLDWRIVARTSLGLMGQTTPAGTATASTGPAASPITTHKTPAALSRYLVEAETPEAGAEPLSLKIGQLAESIGPTTGSLNRVAYFNEAFCKSVGLQAVSVSKPAGWLVTRSDGLLRRFRELQTPMFISGNIPDTVGLGLRETWSARVGPTLREEEGIDMEALREPVAAAQTRLLRRSSTRDSVATTVRRLVQGFGLPLRFLRTAYSRYFVPQKPLTLGLASLSPSVIDAMPETDLRGGQTLAPATPTGALLGSDEAFTYVFIFVPTLRTASTAPKVIPIEIPSILRTYEAAATHIRGTAETTQNLLSSLPSLLSTTLLFSGTTLHMPDAIMGGITTAAGVRAVAPIGTEAIAEEKMLGVGEVRERLERLKQATIAVQRRLMEVAKEVTGNALHVQMSLIQDLQQAIPRLPHARSDASFNLDSMRGHGPSHVLQLPDREGLAYQNYLFYSLPVADMMAMAATSKNVLPGIISTASEYLKYTVGSDVILRAHSSLAKGQVEVDEPYVAVMKDLITYASLSAPSTTVVPPQVPEGLPSARLHEAVSFLLSTRQAPVQEAPTTARRERVVPKPLPVTIEVDSLKDESELRELQRKIARIIKEEARRHGVY